MGSSSITRETRSSGKMPFSPVSRNGDKKIISNNFLTGMFPKEPLLAILLTNANKIRDDNMISAFELQLSVSEYIWRTEHPGQVWESDFFHKLIFHLSQRVTRLQLHAPLLLLQKLIIRIEIRFELINGLLDGVDSVLLDDFHIFALLSLGGLAFQWRSFYSDTDWLGFNHKRSARGWSRHFSRSSLWQWFWFFRF